MAKLTKSSPLLLALGFSAMVTLTLGAGLNIQDFDILSNLAKPVNSLYTEQCPTMCTSACLAVRLMCVNIPGLVNCDDISTICNTQCDGMCQCFSDCTTNCVSSSACEQPFDTLAQATCMIERAQCTPGCQALCPNTAVMNGLLTTFEAAIAKFSLYLMGAAATGPVTGGATATPQAL